jgi:hypothetical protein
VLVVQPVFLTKKQREELALQRLAEKRAATMSVRPAVASETQPADKERDFIRSDRDRERRDREKERERERHERAKRVTKEAEDEKLVSTCVRTCLTGCCLLQA